MLKYDKIYNNIKSSHSLIFLLDFILRNFYSIYKLLFFEFSILMLKLMFLVIFILPELELLLDFIYQDYLVPIEPNKLAQSALFLSIKNEFLSTSSNFYYKLLLNYVKNYCTYFDIYLKFVIFLSFYIENSFMKYLSLMSLLSPIFLGSNLNLMPFWVR